MIPTAFDYERATSVDDALAKLRAAEGAASSSPADTASSR